MKIFFRAVGVVILAVISINLFSSPTGAGNCGTEKEIRLFLRGSEEEDGILTLEVCIESEKGVCALLCDLWYDAERYIYLSGGAVDEKINFKAIDFGSVVGFLLDSRENSAAEDVLAKLYFKRIGQGDAKFTLISRGNALGIGDNSDVISYRVLVLSDTFAPGGNTDNNDLGEPPKLVRLDIQAEKLAFSVKAPDDCFAAGVRLFFTDLSGNGEHFEVSVSGVIERGGTFLGEYLLPDGNYAVVVTAFGYRAKEVTAGEKRVEICK